MRAVVTSLVAVFVGASGSAAEAGSFEADAPLDVVARAVQSELPRCSYDGLMAASPGNGEWSYRLWLAADKTWVVEARVHLRGRDGGRTEVSVDVVRVQGHPLWWDTEEILDAPTASWTRHLSLLANGGTLEADCPERIRWAPRRAPSIRGPSG
jgi:hypothetical protein